MIEIALFQPDIPQNTGTILRMAACLGVTTHVIGPTGFDMSDRSLRRAGMDYLEMANIVRHVSWDHFLAYRAAGRRRVILMTTKAGEAYGDFGFTGDDILLFGRESAGVPDVVRDAADARLIIPMQPGLRSLNVAMAVAMTTGEALRQTNGFAHNGDAQE